MKEIKHGIAWQLILGILALVTGGELHAVANRSLKDTAFEGSAIDVTLRDCR